MGATDWLLPCAQFGRNSTAIKKRRERMKKQVPTSNQKWPEDPSKIRHVLSLSGGKDSAAFAVYLRDRVPRMEYIFHDTGKELPDTYAYLERLEGFLGCKIVRTT